jgi:hypothetical protein
MLWKGYAVIKKHGAPRMRMELALKTGQIYPSKA